MRRRVLVILLTVAGLLGQGCAGRLVYQDRQCVEIETRCSEALKAPTWMDRLPLVFELSPEVVASGWGWQFLEAAGWWERALESYDPQLPDGLIVVSPSWSDRTRTATVWVQIGDLGPDRAGLAQREWTEDCLMRRAIVSFRPDIEPRWRFIVAVHEIGHVLGLEHRLDSQIMHCDPQPCGLDRSCWPLGAELEIAHQGLLGW